MLREKIQEIIENNQSSEQKAIAILEYLNFIGVGLRARGWLLDDPILSDANDEKGFPEDTFWLDMTLEERENFRKHQRATLGFDDSELPNLYAKISAFIAPRLERFADFTMSSPERYDHDFWVSQCKENARKLAGTKKEQCEAMHWVANNFDDLWS